MSTMNWMTPANPAEMDWESFQAEISMEEPSDQLYITSAVPTESMYASSGPNTNTTHNAYQSPTQGEEILPLAVHGHTINTPQSTGTHEPREDSISSARPVEATLYVEGASTRLPFKGRCAENLKSASVVVHAESLVGNEICSETCSPSTETTSVASKNRDGGVLERYLSAEAFSNLLRQIQSTQLDGQNAMLSGGFPMLGYVRAFMRLYFRRFHPTWPFLPPIMIYYEEPSRWLLLLAVIAVGSRYAPGQQCVVYSQLLGNLLESFAPRGLGQLQKRLSQKAFGDEATETTCHEDDLAVLQAAILDVICKSHGSHSRHPKESFSQMFMVSEICRDLGLLEASDARKSGQVPSQALREWINYQTMIRTGLMIWVRDSRSLVTNLTKVYLRHLTV